MQLCRGIVAASADHRSHDSTREQRAGARWRPGSGYNESSQTTRTIARVDPLLYPLLHRGRIIICHWVVSDKQEREPVARIRGTVPPGIMERITRIEMIGLAVNRAAWVLQERQNTSLSQRPGQTQSISDSHQDSRLGKLMVLHPRQNDQYALFQREIYTQFQCCRCRSKHFGGPPPKKIQRLKKAERELEVLSFSFCNIVEWTGRWVG